MQRMGIVTDYFETIVSRIELDDWRMKEDICLLAFEKPDGILKNSADYDKLRDAHLEKIKKEESKKVKKKERRN